MSTIPPPRPLIFKDMNVEQFIKELNREFPIHLEYQKDLIDRVHARYPVLERSQIAYLIKNIFIVIRELLLRGKVLQLREIFNNTRLEVITNEKVGHLGSNHAVRLTAKTPPHLKGRK